MTLCTIVTATTGRLSLRRCVDSVSKQTHADIQHLIIADGNDVEIQAGTLGYDVDVIKLPYSVGKDRWNGHRMYGAANFLAKGEYIMYLDDDNYIDPEHIETCLAAVKGGKYGWSYSLRKIVDQNGNFICNDDCESLGPDQPTVIHQNDRLVDVNCYFLHTALAVSMSPIWFRKAREPGVMEVDRALVTYLAKVPSNGTGKYTVNYAANSSALSVNLSFFLAGNATMKLRYLGDFPWRK